MSNILLAYKNMVDTCTLIDPRVGGTTPWASALNNLKDPLLGNQAQTNVATPNCTWFKFKLAGVVQTAVAAIINHNLSQDAIVRMRMGTAFFDTDFTGGQETDPLFVADLTGASPAGTFINSAGVITAGTTPRIDYDPAYYKNGFLQSSAMNVSWLQTGAFAHPDGRTVSFAATPAYQYQGGLTLYPDSFTISGKARLVSGSGDFCFFVNDGTEHAGPLVTATSDWQDFSQTVVCTAYTFAGTAGIKSVTSDGVLQFRCLQIERNTVKTEYRPTTTAPLFLCKGILREPARTNLLQSSQALATSPWTTNLLTATNNTATSPGGTSAATTLSNGSTGGDCYVTQSASNTGASACSIFVKKNSAARAKLRVLTTATVGTDDSIFFDFAALTFSGATANFTKVGYSPFPGGWFRIWAVKAAQSGQTQTTLRAAPANSSNSTTSGDTLYAWGAQVETGESISSYIPSIPSAGVRSNDIIRLHITSGGIQNATDFNPVEGTVYVEFEVPNSSLIQSSQNSEQIRVNDGGSNFFRIGFVSDPSTPVVKADSSNGLAISSGSISSLGGTTIRAALRYRGSDWAFYVNGTQAGTNGALAVPTTMTEIDSQSGVHPTWLKRMTMWRSGLSNTELAAITTSGPGAYDYDSGWLPACQIQLNPDLGDLAWGAKYDAQFLVSPSRAVEWGVFQMYDPVNVNAVLALGRMFIGAAQLQPSTNADFGLQDSLNELSTQVQASNGTMWTTVRDKPKGVAFSFNYLSLADANKLHELTTYAGIHQEVYYVPDPSDPVYSQRYGFLGQASKLNPLQYPRFASKANAIELRQKK